MVLSHHSQSQSLQLTLHQQELEMQPESKSSETKAQDQQGSAPASWPAKAVYKMPSAMHRRGMTQDWGQLMCSADGLLTGVVVPNPGTTPASCAVQDNSTL